MTVFGFSDLAFMAVAAGYTPTDTDAAAYITAVETADGQALEPGVRRAIDEFVIGCKADGIWSAIKASCILAGARSLTGALVPLVGTAPTNFNFVAGDYDRKTGLVGDGSTKYLDSKRNNNADPQNSCHLAVFGYYTSNYGGIIGDGGNSTVTRMIQQNNSFAQGFKANNSAISSIATQSLGFLGVSRLSPAEFLVRSGGLNTVISETSSAPSSGFITVFRRGSLYSAGIKLAFYSIGESLDLALLDARVTALINAFAAAIP